MQRVTLAADPGGHCSPFCRSPQSLIVRCPRRLRGGGRPVNLLVKTHSYGSPLPLHPCLWAVGRTWISSLFWFGLHGTQLGLTVPAPPAHSGDIRSQKMFCINSGEPK